jgi:hypothetical protein
MAKMVRTRMQASIDFPKAGETVRHPSYTVRIGAPEAATVSVSVDNGGWEPCRQASGFWWFDWAGYVPGPHQLRVQAVGSDGDILAVKARAVTVELAPDAHPG